MSGDQVTFQRRPQSLSAAIRRAKSTDLAVRMRNQMAVDLGHKEDLVDDDYVGVSRGQQSSRWSLKKSEPKFGIVVATTSRLRLVIADGEAITDIPLGSLSLVHDENNAMTFTVKDGRGSTEPMTLIFPKRRAPVAQFLRNEGDGARGRLSKVKGRFAR
ncbi:hypothetical protein BDK89_0136 [Ilumatobacter fluminis]|uniref:Uncharacterized protein n=1 Tax=Ilumatobacter fluminis TaxID=467091 RepID=A0A4R7HUG5_9ACTN|nr:hypothetical protein [Ilumatobacter fluminis]TDT14581.1 hypothetical protein BDK89_0136 [Ilumatobacter fluminis]